MVGALRSNRCQTCQKRKIKCDEAWPVCGPCKRGNRNCPPRPSLKVIDSGRQLRQQYAKKPPGKNGNTSCKGNTALESKLIERTSHKSSALHREVGQGAFGLLLQATMNLAPSDQLCRAFLDSLQMHPPAHNLQVIGVFAWEMPRRFGWSDALDNVAACMLASHAAIVRGASSSSRINPKLYSRALSSVYAAIADPNEWSSSNTLCAILLLQRIEALFGKPFGPSEIIHAAGLASLLEKKGPPQLSDEFDCLVTADSQMCIIHQALVQRKKCFIASEEWAVPLDRLNGQTQLQLLFYQLLRQMTLWPTLVRQKQELWETNTSIDRLTLMQKTQKVKEAVDKIGIKLDCLIKSDGLIEYIPATCLSTVVSEMFKFKDQMAAVLLCYHAMYSIIVHHILLSLSSDPFDKLDLGCNIPRLSRQIWMLVDHGRRNKPLGLPMLPAALLMTVESANWNAQEQIIDIMNELDSCQRLRCESWTRGKLINRAMFYRGDSTVCLSDRDLSFDLYNT